MRALKFFILLLFGFPYTLQSQNDTVRINRIPSYTDWGWEALVIQNNFITAAFVPSMGGNMMQYDFGIDTFLITNPETFGINYDPYIGENPFSGSWGFGGCQIWTTPENWPPPAMLTWGDYLDTVIVDTPDSVQLELTSELEISPLTNIQFEKHVSAYSHSSEIRVKNILRNHRSESLEMGMMIAAEVTTQHNNEDDHENFRIYFPLNSNSRYGESGVHITPSSPAFLGEVLPGIYCVEYAARTGKVYADSQEGWIAYVDERDQQTYVCIFDIFADQNYPEPGARIEIYVEGQVPFMAMEAISPLVGISPEGGAFSFTHHFYSTRLNGPVVKVNHAGAVSERLRYDSMSHAIKGTFGFFNEGHAQLLYRDSTGLLLGEGPVYHTHPDTVFQLLEELDIPDSTGFIELKAFNYWDEAVDLIDFYNFFEEEPVFISEIQTPGVNFNLIGNMITSTDELRYEITLDKETFYTIEVYDLSGIIRSTLFRGVKPIGKYEERISLNGVLPGLYYVVFRSAGNCISEVVTLL